MFRCDIIIPVWNQPGATRECINSIKEGTVSPYRLIIIDNGSGSATKKYLESLKEEFSDFILLRNEKNTGFVEAANKGIAASDAEYLCILNNDTLVTPGWLGELVRVAASDPAIGIVNPASNSLGQRPEKGEGPEGISKRLRVLAGQYVDLGTALGFCMLIKRRVIEKIGMFDEIFSPGNFEDTDFSLRAKRGGFKSVRSLASYVYHREKASFKHLAERRKGFARNKKVFEQRWGKQERILFILKRDPGASDISKRIVKELNDDNWVYIAYARGNFDTKHHSRIILYGYGRYLGVRVLLKIMFKRKKFDRIYCSDGRLSRLINFLSPIHGAFISDI